MEVHKFLISVTRQTPLDGPVCSCSHTIYIEMTKVIMVRIHIIAIASLLAKTKVNVIISDNFCIATYVSRL